MSPTSELSLVAYGNRSSKSKGKYYSSSAAASSAATILNSMFMSTVNSAAKTLVSVAAKGTGGGGGGGAVVKWRPRDHLRFMVMMMTWMSLWALRTVMDHIPTCSFGILRPLRRLIEFPGTTTTEAMSVSALQMILNEGIEAVPVQALSRALSHILALLNDIPATSRKYQFSMAMAERVMDGNALSGSPEMAEVNRVALSSAFDRTATLLRRSLEKHNRRHGHGHVADFGCAWAARAVRALPLGSYVAPYVRGLGACVVAVRSLINTCRSTNSTRAIVVARDGGGWCGGRVLWEEEEGGAVVTEKLAEELLWITNKLRVYGAVDEAVEQWSYASGLASVSLQTDPRLQGLIVKISALIFSEMKVETPRDVKFRLLLVWLPLFCHAGNGFAYPVLTYVEKSNVEKAIDEALWSLPPVDQEVILSNWMQDFAVSASDWPNLQVPYHRWCQSTRNLVD